jgi:hypothetical protein
VGTREGGPQRQNAESLDPGIRAGKGVTKRGAKSRTTIAGHNLTWAELTVLHQLQEYLQTQSLGLAAHGIPLRGIFPGDDPGPNAKRYCARRLAELGVLEACQIELLDDVVKSKGQTP